MTLALLPLLAQLFNFPLAPERASTLAGRVDALFLSLLAFSGAFTLLIGVLVVYFAIKYRAGSRADRRGPVAQSLTREITWVGVPTFIALGLFAWAAGGYVAMATPPPDALEVYVVAKQWMWKFQHVEGPREINELHVPVGRPVRLILTSQDVIHDFFVPAFRNKIDVLPNRYTTLWFEATRVGVFRFFCAEYCGSDHARMIGRVVVLSPGDYERWVESLRPGANEGAWPAALAGEAPRTPDSAPLAPAPNAPDATGDVNAPGLHMAQAGRQLFLRMGCNACHMQGSGALAPDLTGLFRKRVQLEGGQSALADEDYLRESILDPAAKVTAGFRPVMPSYRTQLDAQQLSDLVAYIKSLAPPAPSPAPAPGSPP